MLNLMDEFHQAAFDAVESGQLEVFQSAVDRGFEPNFKNPYRVAGTSLHLAAQKGHLNIVAYLIGINAIVNVRDDLDRTPLHLAHNEEICKLLIDNGADIEAADFNLWRPLHWAVKHKNPKIMDLLLQSGADPDAMDLDGNTPCHVAADYGQIQLLKYLLPPMKSNFCNGQNDTVYDLVRKRFADHTDYHKITELLKASEEMKGPPVLLEALPEPRKLENDYLKHLTDYPAFVGHVNPEPTTDDLTATAEALDVLCELEDACYKDEYLQQLLVKYSHPRIHWIPDGHPGCEIAVRVQRFVAYLLEKAADIDPRFAGTVEPIGSAADGSKLGKTDEFDFLLSIKDLSNPISTQLEFVNSEGSTESGFVKVLLTEEGVQDRWRTFMNANNELDYIEVNNYFRFVMWETSRRLSSLNKFGFTFRKVLIMGDFDHKFPKHGLPLVRFMMAGCKLLLHCQVSGLWIDVDVVPGFKMEGWPQQHTIPYEELKKIVPASEKISYCIVAKTHTDMSAEGLLRWQLSFATTEKMIISNSGEKLLNALRILKILKTLAQEAKVDKYEWLTSYVMKTGFLRYLASSAKESSANLNLTDIVIKILQIIRAEVTKNLRNNNSFVVYSFFVPKFVSSSGHGATEFLELLDKLEAALSNGITENFIKRNFLNYCNVS